MSVKLLTEHHSKFLSLKEAGQARLSLHLSKCHVVGNHIIFLMFLCFRHSEELIRKLEQAGLGYHVDADKTTDRLGKMSCVM